MLYTFLIIVIAPLFKAMPQTDLPLAGDKNMPECCAWRRLSHLHLSPKLFSEKLPWHSGLKSWILSCINITDAKTSLRVEFGMEASNSTKKLAQKMAGRCCFILTLNPIVTCATLGDDTQAYLVSTLLTTLNVNKTSHWVVEKEQHDHKYSTSSLRA